MYTSNFNPPSVVPALFSGLSRQMRFDERVVNFLINLLERMLLTYQASIVESYTKLYLPQLPSVPQMIHDVDVTLVNANQLLDYPKLISPNTKYLGGMQLQRTTKVLHPVSIRVIQHLMYKYRVKRIKLPTILNYTVKK